MNSILASLLVFNNTDKRKWSHDLVVSLCWSVDDLVVVVIHLGWKFELIVQVFAMHQFFFIFQSHGRQVDEVQTCVLWDVIDYDTLGVVLIGDDVDEHSKS